MIDYLAECYELLWVSIVLIIILMTGCCSTCKSELESLKAPSGWSWKVKLVKDE